MEDWSNRFSAAIHPKIVRRMGVKPSGTDADNALVMAFNDFMMETQTPYEQALFDLYGGPKALDTLCASPVHDMYDHAKALPLKALLGQAAPIKDEPRDHAYFRGRPCTMLYDEVESIWAASADSDDWSLLAEKLADIAVMRDALKVYG